jgi:hypothetical protein
MGKVVVAAAVSLVWARAVALELTDPNAAVTGPGKS